MITPAYAPTATERVLPRLALDFTTGTLDPRVSVARPLNTATRVNSSGLIEAVNADLPRFDYNPVTLAPKGLLIEEARANNFTYSNDFSQAAWLKSNVSLDAAATTAPDGTLTGWRLRSNAGVAGNLYRDPGLGGESTFSIFAKEGEWRYIQIVRGGGYSPASNARIDLRTGTLTSGSGYTTEQYKDGWWRIYGTATYTSGDRVIYIFPTNAPTFPNTNGDGTSGVYIAFTQTEAGAFATSYIPTTTTSLTRNADVVTMTGTNFSSWFNASEGTFVVTTSVLNLAADRPIMQTSTGALANGGQFVYYNPAGSRFGYRAYDSTGATVGAVNYTSAGTPAINTTYCTAIGYKTDAFIISANGAAVGQDTVGTVSGAPDTLRIGRDTASAYLNGHMKKLNFYPQRLINAETQAFAKG